MAITVKWKKLHPDAIIPVKQHRADAGYDLFALEDTVIAPLERKAVRTGLAVEIPEGYEMQIRPRSGLSLKSPLIIANSPGTVDASYRGEVMVILWNTSLTQPYFVKKADRIAQAVFARIPEVEFVEVEELSPTERGEEGFGSTGK